MLRRNRRSRRPVPLRVPRRFPVHQDLLLLAMALLAVLMLGGEGRA